MAILRPRKPRNLSSDLPTSSSPSRRIDPSTIRPGGSSRPRIDQPVTVLPDPDSPTRPRTSPRATVKLTPSTALMTPARVKKCVFRFSTARTVCSLPPCGGGLGRGVVVVARDSSPTPTPTPNPSPQGGGEFTELAAPL